MTVSELIEALKALPQDMEVYMAGVSEMDGDLLAGATYRDLPAILNEKPGSGR